VDLGSLGGYRLPAAISNAFGVTTAQELADQLGVTKAPTPALGPAADSAYQALRRGDSGPARRLLVDDLGISEATADEALAKLPSL
jgi:hypothetical protein